jgi:4,5-dihydroxyphthalate decarboxylase
MSETVEIIGGDYEFTLELGGSYASGALNIRYNPAGVQASFGAILQKKPFQACEFSLANFLMMRDRGADWMVATPVFLNRQFRHACILVRKDSPLKTFSDLKGKRVGAKEYSQTAVVWFRGMLKDHYDVDWRDIHWTCGKVQRFPPPVEADVTLVEDEPEDMLLAGSLDALLAVQVKDNALPPAMRKLRPLLPDVESEERAYYTKTGIYPLNHTVVIDVALAAKQPELARAIVDAYGAAKRAAYKRKLGSTLMPWGDRYWAETMAFFGGDPLPHGLTPRNREQVETLARYVHEQGLMAKPLAKADDLFVPGAADFKE